MKQYLDQLQNILDNGTDSDDRTGVGTRRIFGSFARYNLQDGFPIVTTRKMPFGTFVAENLWFLEGSTDERRLAELTYCAPREMITDKKTIWLANADAQGKALGYVNTDTVKELGPVYGRQFRNWDGIDQIANLVEGITTNPNGRRHILSAWNVAQIPEMALPPCHTMSVFGVINGKLNCHLTQRSGDMFLGVPANIVGYALLTHMIAKVCKLEVGDFCHTIVDAHIYKNHIPQVIEQLSRKPLPLPKLIIDPEFAIYSPGFRYNYDDRKMFRLEGYESHEKIHAEMAV